MRSTTRAASVALVAALFVAACGSDETDDVSGSGDVGSAESAGTTVDTVPDTTPDSVADDSATTSVPEEAGQDVEADAAAAQTALLTAADLPEGWTESPRSEEAAMVRSDLDARLAECVGVDADGLTGADAAARSDQFLAPDGTLSLTQDVGVLATERDARSVIAFTAEPGVPACFGEAYGALAADLLAPSLAEGATVGTPVATRLQVGSAGDATQAIRVTVPVTGDTAVVEVTIDHVLVRGDRAVASLTFENRAAATPVETIDGLTAVVATRLGA